MQKLNNKQATEAIATKIVDINLQNLEIIEQSGEVKNYKTLVCIECEMKNSKCRRKLNRKWWYKYHR